MIFKSQTLCNGKSRNVFLSHIALALVYVGILQCSPIWAQSTPRYLSEGDDPDPAYFYLESLQEIALKSPRIHRKWESTEADSARFIHLISEMNNRSSEGKHEGKFISDKEAAEILEEINHVKVPTPYEDPIAYLMLQETVANVESARTALNLEIPYKPKFGTLPLPIINAETVLVPGSHERLIVLNSQVFIFTQQMAKAILQSIPFALDSSTNYIKIPIQNK